MFTIKKETPQYNEKEKNILSALLIIPAAGAGIFSYQVEKQAAMGLLYFNENNTTKTHDI